MPFLTIYIVLGLLISGSVMQSVKSWFSNRMIHVHVRLGTSLFFSLLFFNIPQNGMVLVFISHVTGNFPTGMMSGRV